jgi:hypothetical protein
VDTETEIPSVDATTTAKIGRIKSKLSPAFERQVRFWILRLGFAIAGVLGFCFGVWQLTGLAAANPRVGLLTPTALIIGSPLAAFFMWAMLTESLREAVLIGENGFVLNPGRYQIVVLWSEIESFEMVKEPSTWLAHYSLLIHKSDGGGAKICVFNFPDVRTLQHEVENALIRRDVDFFYPQIVNGETAQVSNVLVSLE